MSCVALIPARGGSKGIPRKNIKPFNSKPLIYWSIKIALESNKVDRVIVSTDDEEIADIARSFSAEVPFMRPKKYSMDNSSGLEPILMTDGSKKKFCHRHLVAEWLENELGIIIEEYKVGKVTRSKGYMKKNINPTLF